MTGKKGLIAAVIALVAIVALAGIAYGALAPAAKNSSSDEVATSSAQSNADSASPEVTSSVASEETSAVETVPLPEFTVHDREGNEVALASMQGKPTFVGYWATWCPPCNEEAPEIQKLYDEFGDRVNFMMISYVDNQRETAEGIEEWLAQNGYTYPVYLDMTGDAMIAGQVQYIPTTFLLDEQGNILYSSTGILDEASGTQLLNSALSK